MQTERESFHEPESIFLDVKKRLSGALAASEQVNYITFVPDGEPTLDLNLGREIELLKELKIPVGVITNGSLLRRDEVKCALLSADWVSVKIDSVDEAIWRRINRPHPELDLSLILKSLLEFTSEFNGIFVTETMLVKGINDTENCIDRTAEFISRLRPETSYLSVPTRPTSEQWAGMPDEPALNKLYQILAGKVPKAECLTGYEGNAFAYTGDIERDLLGITAVHPMREDAVESMLKRAKASWAPVDRLVSEGRIVKTIYNGHLFYLRSLKNENGGDK
jgi:wyosine [tRNA(Phe)-imidazoG37] synthetase (radical SAM superfamily)